MSKTGFEMGTANPRASLFKETIRLMRIPFSYFLMPVFLFALSQSHPVNVVHAVLCFVALHLFIYPASNGYNSYMDQDETSIGGLKNPPLPTRKVFYLSIIFDLSGLILAGLVNIQFFLGVLAYLLASRAYSYKGIRLKKMPLAGFLTVVIFQGGFTFWMVLFGISTNQVQWNLNMVYAVLACSFLIAGVYPLTQIYQHEADLQNGDITISSRLGYKGTFVFSVFMFVCAGVLLAMYFFAINRNMHFILFQIFLLPVFVYFLGWYLKVVKNIREASFENTMRMNVLASTSMNLYFITLFILNQYR
jgi:1,4-dihydroxy-2-naphthoate octaprenyltransferase